MHTHTDTHTPTQTLTRIPIEIDEFDEFLRQFNYLKETSSRRDFFKITWKQHSKLSIVWTYFRFMSSKWIILSLLVLFLLPKSRKWFIYIEIWMSLCVLDFLLDFFQLFEKNTRFYSTIVIFALKTEGLPLSLTSSSTVFL